MNSKTESKSRRSKEVAFLYTIGLVEWKRTKVCRTLSYAAALRQLAANKLQTPGTSSPPVCELFQALCERGDPGEAVCELCGEAVSRRKGFMDRRFGILENCSHVFCLGCIRSYRHLALVQEQVSLDCVNIIYLPLGAFDLTDTTFI